MNTKNLSSGKLKKFVKSKRATAIEQVGNYYFIEKQKRPLPRTAQYLGRRTIISKFASDSVLEKTDDLKLPNDQLDGIENWQSVKWLDLIQQSIPAGVDYKGQLQSCYTVLGYGMKADLSIDLGKIADGGFLSTQISPKASARKSNPSHKTLSLSDKILVH
jgi:hypothetical protein